MLTKGFEQGVKRATASGTTVFKSLSWRIVTRTDVSVYITDERI
ncbi:hypothetical protein [Halomarina pelagica]|nr:hypothetical protein [Halomarina sp. BND7]